MRNHFLGLVLLAAVSSPAAASDKEPVIAAGYSFLAYLGQGGGSAPFGLDLSLATQEEGVGVEGDVAYHREAGGRVVVHTITASVGPRWGRGGGNRWPFLHALGLLKYDFVEGGSRTQFGVMVGAGVDLGPDTRTRFRLAADVQALVSGGLGSYALRLTAGVRF